MCACYECVFLFYNFFILHVYLITAKYRTLFFVYLTLDPATYSAHHCDAARDQIHGQVFNFRDEIETPAAAVMI